MIEHGQALSQVSNNADPYTTGLTVELTHFEDLGGQIGVRGETIAVVDKVQNETRLIVARAYDGKDQISASPNKLCMHTLTSK